MNLSSGQKKANEKSVTRYQSNQILMADMCHPLCQQRLQREITLIFISLFFHGGLLSVCHVPLKESSMVASSLTNRAGRAPHASIPAELLGFKTIEDCLESRIYIKINLGSSHTLCFKDRTTIVIITTLALSPFLTTQPKYKYSCSFLGRASICSLWYRLVPLCSLSENHRFQWLWNSDYRLQSVYKHYISQARDGG